MSDSNSSVEVSKQTKEKMTSFQKIIAAAIIFFVVQSLVMMGVFTSIMVKVTSKPTDIERVQQMVVPGGDDVYLYKELMDVATGKTAKWRVFDAGRGFPVVEVSGTIRPELEDALIELLFDDGIIEEPQLDNLSFRLQFIPRYASAESFISEMLPSFAMNTLGRRWSVGYQTFDGVDDGSGYIDVPEYLISAVFSTF